MKRLLLVATLGLVVAFGFVPQQVAQLSGHLTPTLVAQEDPAKITVYITRTGEKYHLTAASICARAGSPQRSRRRSLAALGRAACASRRRLRRPNKRSPC